MSETASSTDIIIGVDTHKLTHAVVAISALGARLGSLTIPANSRGYQALQAWARSLGVIRAFGIEGTDCATCFLEILSGRGQAFRWSKLT